MGIVDRLWLSLFGTERYGRQLAESFGNRRDSVAIRWARGRAIATGGRSTLLLKPDGSGNEALRFRGDFVTAYRTQRAGCRIENAQSVVKGHAWTLKSRRATTEAESYLARWSRASVGLSSGPGPGARGVGSTRLRDHAGRQFAPSGDRSVAGARFNANRCAVGPCSDRIRTDP